MFGLFISVEFSFISITPTTPREFNNLLSSQVESYFVEFTKFNLIAINYNFAMVKILAIVLGGGLILESGRLLFYYLFIYLFI